ncbi:MAG: hypothetical protein HC816_13530 [Leptolyngbyaceae cyanobacterium RM1_1_2]|nr:hypothetical protein [Leptolyngbyaceae cyanobacterium RM1_1_2]NJN89921.1 hypothetical protein [Leptolyngbyaceae cyanobacterium SL_5_14]
MITGILLILITLGGVYWFVLYPTQKIRKIKNCVVLEVDGADTRYSDLPLGKLGVFYEINEKQRVRVVFPKLTPEGDVQYIYSWHDLQSIHIPGRKKINAQNKANLKAAQELASLIKEHLQLELEILNLREQWQKISDLLDLVATSDFYASQQEIYERALFQVENLLSKAEDLQDVYVRFIREALIGNKIVGYNPDLLLDGNVGIDSQYKVVRAEYQRMKDTATAYAELLRTRQV